MSHKHHIVFRSHHGLDTDANMIDLSYMDHEGNDGPHLNREVDLKLKTDLQDRYYKMFANEEYEIPEIAKILGKSEKYIYKHFRKVKNFAGIYKREEIIKELMGGRFY
jgi:DNA-binding CsgD family transcriptional regulator